MRNLRTLTPLALVLVTALAVAGLAQRGIVHQTARIQVERTGAVTLRPKTGQVISLDGDTTLAAGRALGYSATAYSGTSSFQPVAVDLNLAAGAGSTDGRFLSPVMGNVFGTNLTKSGNYVAGGIGALSVTGTRATELQVGGLLGVVMDGSTGADGAVVAVIDGSDPSTVTRANAAFAARLNNNNAGSGVDYGVDLYDAGRSSGLYTGGGVALAVAKADLRLTNEVCVLSGTGAPVDGTSGTGAGFAGPGSLYVRRSGADSKLYINTNTKASPTWTIVGSQT